MLNGALRQDVRREDVVGAYAGLRPLLDTGTTTADLSRKHAVLVSSSGVVTVVGGKLTTYRQMAQDAVDRAVADARLTAGPCRHEGAAAARRRRPGTSCPACRTHARLVRRFGIEAAAVLAEAVRGHRPPGGRAAGADRTRRSTATLAELVFGVTHEGARTVEDLLDRRTRIGLVPEDRELAPTAAERALAYSQLSASGLGGLAELLQHRGSSAATGAHCARDAGGLPVVAGDEQAVAEVDLAPEHERRPRRPATRPSSRAG